jgi:hypothetical protein
MMRRPMFSLRRFFAYIVLGFWITVTLVGSGDFVAEHHADAVSAHEAVFHAKPDSKNVEQSLAEADAMKRLVDFQADSSSPWVFRLWLGLTLLGAALLAERGRSKV